jgi:hypothetical protein
MIRYWATIDCGPQIISYDILNNSNEYSHLYTEDEKSLLSVDWNENRRRKPYCITRLLVMYANPVVNKLKYHNAQRYFYYTPRYHWNEDLTPAKA